VCGRYFFDLKERMLCDSLATQVKEKALDFKRGEIFPSQRILVRDASGYRTMIWGMAYGFSKKLLINGRLENITGKKTFAEAVVARRIAIPATAYFEWEKTGRKSVKRRIHLSDEVFMMAGVYNWFMEKGQWLPRAVILTREAQDTVAKIHDRMPVILPESLLDSWLGKGEPESLLKAVKELSYEKLLVDDISGGSQAKEDIWHEKL